MATPSDAPPDSGRNWQELLVTVLLVVAALATSWLRVSLTTTHLAVGSLVLATSLVLTLRTHRLKTASTPMVAQTLLSEQVSL